MQRTRALGLGLTFLALGAVCLLGLTSVSEAPAAKSGPKKTITDCKQYGTATAMGVWDDAIATEAGKQWVEEHGPRNSGIKDEWGCPDPEKLEVWGSVCYGKCPAGYKRTFLCSCREE